MSFLKEFIFNNNDYLSLFALLFSAVSIVISVVGWRKSRSIYGIESVYYDPFNSLSQDLVNKKLSSGSYILLNILEREKTDSEKLQESSMFIGYDLPSKKSIVVLGKIKN